MDPEQMHSHRFVEYLYGLDPMPEESSSFIEGHKPIKRQLQISGPGHDRELNQVYSLASKNFKKWTKYMKWFSIIGQQVAQQSDSKGRDIDRISTTIGPAYCWRECQATECEGRVQTGCSDLSKLRRQNLYSDPSNLQLCTGQQKWTRKPPKAGERTTRQKSRMIIRIHAEVGNSLCSH